MQPGSTTSPEVWRSESSMLAVRRMLQQALRVSARGAFPLLKWMERCTERVSAGHQGARTLDQMPGPNVLSFAWDLFAKRGLSRLHELQVRSMPSFGPILTVHIADPGLIEQVLRQEGLHPMRSELSSWKDYRQLRGHHYGLLTAEGEEWQTVRSLLGKHMLRPKAVEAYDQTLNSVVSDLIDKLRFSRKKSGLVPDIASEFYRFGLEGKTHVSISSHLIFSYLSISPSLNVVLIKNYNELFLCSGLCPAKGHIDQRMAAEAEKVSRGEKVEGRYLTYFLSQTGLPMKTVYSNVTELLLAGVDTISSTLSWSLYELSRHPEVQSRLRGEVLKVLGDRRIPNAADVAQMPLLKATVKEVLRLYPVIPGNARVITERDIQVGGYVIPKKTLITLCHFATSRDPAVFQSPDEFLPERWLNRDQSHHPYASVPFGVGKRSCIGRRIAELELYLAISRILLEFDVKPDPGGVSVKPMTRTLLVPESQINLQFIELRPSPLPLPPSLSSSSSSSLLLNMDALYETERTKRGAGIISHHLQGSCLDAPSPQRQNSDLGQE
uniref:Uncharacterized protein n=1 Tax=Periophthalmus magnuspinnatus TaxID=409849 RepID=A0A3B4B640_9GOBI